MDQQVSLQRRRVDLADAEPFDLGAARINPGGHEAVIADRRERIQPQPMKVLVALHDRAGELVGRDELIERCWDGRIVGDDRCVSVLRRFAGRTGGFTIETVPKAGYRLVEGAAIGGRRGRRTLAAVVAGAVILVILGLMIFQLSRGPARPTAPSIAILPFETPAADTRSKELAAQARNALSHSLSDGGFPVALVAAGAASERRSADFLISGDLRRLDGGFIATIRIERPSPRVIIFSDQFEAKGPDSNILPERIGAQVAAILSWTGALMILDRREKSDPAVTNALLKNTALVVQGRDLMRSYEIARRLAPRAPNSTMAQLSVAFNTAFVLDGIPREQRASAVAVARRAADRAAALSPEFGDVYAPWCLLRSSLQARACEDRLRYALRVDPNAPFVPFFLSLQLESVGRFEEALELARTGLANDRYKLWKIARLVHALEVSGGSAEAERFFVQANRWWPNHPVLAWHRREGILKRGDFRDVARFEEALGPQQLPPAARSPPALLRAIGLGDLATVRAFCAQHPSTAPVICMLGLARLGDRDAAFAIADSLYPDRRGRSPAEQEALWLDKPQGTPLAYLASPAAASLRRDRRYLRLVQRVGLRDYWMSGRPPDFCTARPEPLCAALRP